MDSASFKTIKFKSITIGSLKANDLGGSMMFWSCLNNFRLGFCDRKNNRFKFLVYMNDIKKVIKSFEPNNPHIIFVLTPSAVKKIGNYLNRKNYVFQISSNVDESKFQVSFSNRLTLGEVGYLNEFFFPFDTLENASQIEESSSSSDEDRSFDASHLLRAFHRDEPNFKISKRLISGLLREIEAQL